MYAIRRPTRVTRLVYFSGTGIDPAWHEEYHRNREERLSRADRDRLLRLSEQRRFARGSELRRINEERTTLCSKTEYYDADQLDEIPVYDRFPINYTQNSVLGAEVNRTEQTGELEAQVAHIKAPTFVLDGEADPRPRWARAQIAELIPDSHHVTIPHSGHEPWFEQPDATRKALRELLTETV